MVNFFPLWSRRKYQHDSMLRQTLNALLSVVQWCFGRFNYQVNPVPSTAEVNHHKVIKELELLYADKVFDDFRLSDDTRIQLLSELIGAGISHALHIVYYLDKSSRVIGDVCEFGVAQGATSALIANEIRGSDKNLWLFDSFEGLPKPSEKDHLINDIFNLGDMEAYTGKMSVRVTVVQKKLKRIDFPASRTQIVPGFIEHTINFKELPQKVSFAFLDFDFYEPTVVALRFLDKVLQKGGYIAIDDYGYFSTGVKTAVDEFLAEHADQYKSLPTVRPAEHLCVVQRILEPKVA